MAETIMAISNFGSMVGGGEHSFIDLITNLPLELEPIIVSPHEGELAEKLRGKGVETHIVPLPLLRPWLTPYILKSLKAYYQLCLRHNISVIYANGSRAAFYAGLVGRVLKIPVVWHCRIAERDPYLDSILVFLCTKIISNSKATAKRFKSLGRSKIQVVYNGFDLKWFQDKTVQRTKRVNDEWKIVLSVARVSKLKRHDLILAAFESIAKSYQNVHLVCIGAPDPFDPKWWNYLQKKTRKSEFRDRIHWLGQIQDLRPWYLAASVLVLASELEGFGRVIVEAIACGVPVVATEVGGVPEIINHGIEGFLIPPGDIIRLTKAIEKLLEHEELRNRLGSSALVRAEYFSLDKHVCRMTNIFKQIIGK